MQQWEELFSRQYSHMIHCTCINRIDNKPPLNLLERVRGDYWLSVITAYISTCFESIAQDAWHGNINGKSLFCHKINLAINTGRLKPLLKWSWCFRSSSSFSRPALFLTEKEGDRKENRKLYSPAKMSREIYSTFRQKEAEWIGPVVNTRAHSA